MEIVKFLYHNVTMSASNKNSLSDKNSLSFTGKNMYKKIFAKIIKQK